MKLCPLITLDQFDKSLLEYTHELKSSYSYWKDGISVKAAAYLYIGGLKVKALRADLMTNWQACKYDSLIALQNVAAKKSLWRSPTVNIPRILNPLLLRTKVRHLCRCRRTNVLTAILVKAVMTVMAVMAVLEVKVLLAVNYFGAS